MTTEEIIEASDRTQEVWTCTLRGRRYRLEVTPGLRATLTLGVDGEQVEQSTSTDSHRRIPLGDGRRVEAWLSSRGRLKRATAYDGSQDLDFDAPEGSKAARTQAWGREHPVLFALRHLLIKGGGILIALLGLGALFTALVEPLIRWLAERLPPMPRIPWPEFDLPDIPWPHIRLPQIPWPDVTPPAWLLALIDWLDQYDDIVKPLVIGLIIALAEMRRQRRQRRLREEQAHAEQIQSADEPQRPE